MFIAVYLRFQEWQLSIFYVVFSLGESGLEFNLHKLLF